MSGSAVAVAIAMGGGSAISGGTEPTHGL
jgi:hypothetical protein